MSTDLCGDAVTPEFGRQALGEIAELNESFIALLARLYAIESDPPVAVLEMPAEQIGQLVGLTRPATRRLTHCAVTLFDLHLDDLQFWSQQCTGGERYRQCAITDASLRNELKLFTLSALMYLRHLAGVNRFLARLSFSVSAVVLDYFAGLPIVRLREVASTHPGLLRGRLGGNNDAWAELVRLVRRNDAQPMVTPRLLGYHQRAAR